MTQNKIIRCFLLAALLTGPCWGAQADVPVITTEPTNVTAPAGSTVSFTVVATGTGTLTYHWKQDGVAVPGSTATLTLANISDSEAGGYTVVVTNSSGSVTSTPPAILTLTHPPVVTTQPASQVVNTGDEVLFFVGVNGATPFSYQWQTNGTAINGETDASLDLDMVQDSDAGTYSVVVTNSDGTSTSAGALLTVVEPILVGTPPITSPVNTCTNVTLTVLTYGSDPTLQYQWYSGVSMIPVGTNGPTLILTDISPTSAGMYSVTVSNSAGSFAVASGTLNVQDPPPVIVNGPSNILVQTGAGNANCSATATWTPPSAVDNCPGVTLTSNFHPGDTFMVGTNTVTYTATDSANQSTNYSFTVTVQDTTPPVPVFHSISVQLDASGNYTLTPADVANIGAGSSDACTSVTESVSPTNFTFCNVGTSAVTLTVTDTNGNSASTNGTITVLAPTGVPAVVYVDASYTSCGPLTFPDASGTGAYFLGYNAFATIQGAINAVAPGGIVNVAAGTYPEVLAVNKSLTLSGARAGQNANVRFAAFAAGGNGPKADPTVESVITAATADPTDAANDSIHIMAGNVTIDGFVIDGNNSGLAQGGAVVIGGINTDSRRAVETEDAAGNLFSANNVLIKNNIIQNYAQRGVEIANPADTSPATSGSLISGNIIRNFGLDGILLAYNAYGDVTSNTVEMADGGEAGIRLQDFPSSGASPKTLDWSHNTVTVCQDAFGGIWANLFYASAATFNIHDNTVNAAAGVTGDDDFTYGIYLTSLQNGTTANLTNNMVGAAGGQFARGIALWNVPTTATTTIAGGTVSNAVKGVSLHYNDPNFGGAGASFAANLDGVNISGADAGVLVDATASGSDTVQMQISSNTVISSCATGISILGANASANIHDNASSITGNGVGVSVDTGVALLANNDLSGNTLAGISATNGAIVDAGNCTGSDVTGLGISPGGNNLSGYGFAGGPAWAVINGNAGGSPVVLADHDNFGAMAGDNVAGAFSGAVEYSQSPAVLVVPADLNLVCASAVPAGATDLAGFENQGGYYAAGAATVSFSDDTNFAGSGVIHRTYTVTDGCGLASTGVQTITVSDTVAPMFTMVPMNMTNSADPGECSKANVTWVVNATDNCGTVGVVSIPPSGSTFLKGTTTVTNMATDASGNTSVATFTVTVNDTEKPVVTVWPANATLDVGGQCDVAVPDLTTQIRATDNCDAPVYSQSPAAGTLVSLGVTNVLVTVSDLSGNSISSNVTLTVVDTAPAPLATYVDASFAGLPTGAVVTFPNVGGTGTHYIGCDAFATIQTGISRVATNGTVNVAGGAYVEDVTIDRPLNLLGPNATNNPNTGTRSPEAIIYPATQGPDPFTQGEIVVYVTANNVVIKGFTVDGDNPAMTGGTMVGTNDVDASEGIVSYEGVGSITVANDIVRNTTYTGVDFYNYNNGGTATTGNHIACNRFDNLGAYGFGVGVLIYNNFYADISNNVMTNVVVGVQTGNFSQSNPGTTQSINHNTIATSGVGVFFNLMYSGTSTFTICSNKISFLYLANSAEWDGMLITSIQGAVGVNIISNTICGTTTNEATIGYATVGYNIWNTPTTGEIAISGGSVSNANYGVWVNDFDGYASTANALTAATISGVTISGSSAAGIYVQDDPQALGNGGFPVQATVAGNTVISNSAVGVLVQGTHAGATLMDNTSSITGNGVGVSVDTGVALLANNDLSGNTLAGISATNGAIVDAGNCTGSDVTGLGISPGGNNLSGYGFAGGPAWAVINGNAGGSPVVLADHDNFGAMAGDNVAGAFSGMVEYSQSPAVLVVPADLNLVCASAVPAGATDLAGFENQGGYYAAGAATVSFSDDTNFAGSGVIHRTYTVTDGCGLASTGVQTITVSDTVAPMFTMVPMNMTNSADPGECSKANVTWVVSATDNCGTVGVVSIPPSGSTFLKGTTTVTNMATDASGNTSVATFTVTVNDTEKPVISQCANNETIDADVTAHASLPDLTSQIRATDNCGLVTLSQIPAPGTVVGLGDTQVTLWATDSSGNSNFCTATVTVKDVTPPMITCVGDVTVTVLQAKDPYATGTPTATDANGPVTITYTDDPSDLTNCDATGVIVRTWAATDAANNTNFCVQRITVVDNIAPQFTVLSTNITVTNDPGLCSAVVNYVAPVALDTGYFQGFEDTNFVSNTNGQSLDWHDGNSHLYRVPSGTDGIISSSGAAHAVIDSTVPQAGPDYSNSGAYTFLDGINSAFGTGYRVAVDVYMNLNDPAVTGATATTGYGWDLSTAAADSQGNNLRDFIFHTAAYGPSGIVVGADNNSNDGPDARRNDLLSLTNHAVLTQSGWYTFEWQFHNGTNNALAVDMNVRDTNGAVLFTETRSDSSDVISNVGGNPYYTWFIFVFADKLAIDNTIFEHNIPVISSVPSGFAFPVGTTTVNNTATDACGNTTNAAFTVTVNDVEPPTIACPSNIVIGVDTPHGDAIVNFPAPVVSDNCGISNVTVIPAAGSHFPIGTTTVSNIVTDIHGNTSVCTFAVTVVDVPIIVTQPLNQTNSAGTTATFSVAVSSTVPITYQWSKGGAPLVDNGRISGSGTNVLTIANVSDADVDAYTVTISNLAGNVTSMPATLTVIDPPFITSAPVSITTNIGSTVTFAVTATGTAPLHYQWQQNNLNILGATGSSLTLNSVSDSDAGGYQVIVSNVLASVTSAPPAILTLLHPPVIVPGGQPSNATVTLGQPVTFSVSANGASPFSYQWRKTDINIGTATNRVFSLSHVADTDAGNYSVFITNMDGSTTSREALLTVVDPPVITNQPVSLTNNAQTTAIFTVGVDGTAPFSYQWVKNGTNNLSNGGNISGATNATLVVSNVLAADTANYTVVVSNAATTVTSSVAALVVIDPVILTQPAGLTQNAGSTAAFSVSAAGTSISYQWLENGVTVSNVGNVSGATSSNLVLTGIADVNAAVYSVVVSNSLGSFVISSNATLTVVDPPVITNQPVNITANAGTTAQFSVGASGTAPGYQWFKGMTPISGATTAILTLTNVSDADASSYYVFLTNAAGTATSSNATLTVIDPPVITLQPSSRTNNAATTATFNVAVTGTAPFAFQWVKDGTNTLSDGGNISGATNSTLTISNVLAADEGGYTVVISNPAQTVTSSNADLVVIDPVITSQPTNVSAIVRSTIHFAVVASGTPSLSYQWQMNGFNLSDGFGIGGSHAPVLSITNITDSDAGSYTVVVSNSIGSVTSAPAILITFPPLITVQPVAHYVNQGQPTAFSVSVNGALPFTYQWQKNDTDINSETNRILSFGPTAFTDTANYRVIVSNPEGTETSIEAALTVVGPTVPIMGTPVYVDGQVSVSLTATPGFNYAIQASTNLMDWISLQTNTAPFIYLDTNTSSFGMRYYRGLYLP